MPLLFLRIPKWAYGSAESSGVIIFTVLFALYQTDNMSNNFPNPLFMLGLGGLCGLIRSGGVAPVALRLETVSVPARTLPRNLLAGAEPA
jgi:hypothetical protein